MSTRPFDLDRIGGRRVLTDLLTEIVAAGEEAMRLYREGAAHRAKRKPDRSPVTEADEAVERRLRAFLASRVPGAGFLGEETGESRTGDSGLRFIVDPIDGTRAFLRGIPTWSILVGLEADGEPVVGIAHLPAAEQLYVGVKGEGALGNGRPLRVSDVAELDSALIQHGALCQFAAGGCIDVLERLANETYTQHGTVDFGGYRAVLEGRADAMIDPATKAWDVCPAAVLVREAGGRFTSLTGEETIYGGGGLATNGRLHDAMLELVNRNT